MRFGREVDDGTGLVLGQQAFEQGGVANVALHEDVAGVALHAIEVVQVASVGELVEVDHGLVAVGYPVKHEVGANEAGAASYQNCHTLELEKKCLKTGCEPNTNRK